MNVNADVPLFFYQQPPAAPPKLAIAVPEPEPRSRLPVPSFFLYDDSEVQESDPPEDAMHFFHPPDTPLEVQLYAAGVVSALAAFAQQFASDEDTPLSTIQLSRCKLGLRRVAVDDPKCQARIVIVVGADESDEALERQLDALTAALRFYYGPWSAIVQRAADHGVPLRDETRNLMLELVPLAEQSARDALAMFAPLPYVSVPADRRRVFLEAAQLLRTAKRTEAGAVFYEGSVLHSTLDTEHTRWVLNRIEYMRLSAAVALVETGVVESSEDLTDFSPVYDDAHKRWVGIYIFTVGQVSLAVLMDVALVEDPEFARALRLAALPRMRGLEFELDQLTPAPDPLSAANPPRSGGSAQSVPPSPMGSEVYYTFDAPPSASSSASVNAFVTPEPPSLNSSVVTDSADSPALAMHRQIHRSMSSLRRSRHRAMNFSPSLPPVKSAGEGREKGRPPAPSAGSGLNADAYRFLLYDPVSENLASGESFGAGGGGLEGSGMLEHVRHGFSRFYLEKDVSQVVVGDHSGASFCRRGIADEQLYFFEPAVQAAASRKERKEGDLPAAEPLAPGALALLEERARKLREPFLT